MYNNLNYFFEVFYVMLQLIKKGKQMGARYSKHTKLKICEMIANGRSLESICRLKKYPNAGTVYDWRLHDKWFAELYARARVMQAEKLFESVLQIVIDLEKKALKEPVPNSLVQIYTLKVNTIKWCISKIIPDEVYSNLIEIDNNDNENDIKLIRHYE